MKNLGIIVLTMALLILVGCGRKPDKPKGNPEAEKAAIQAAKQWLALVDNGQYAKSWEDAAQYFKGVVANEQWQQSIQGVRGPLGRTISRELKSQEYKTSLPGAPDGQYVVIQFATSFQNKESAIETITPMLDPDGKWRVSGYYIR